MLSGAMPSPLPADPRGTFLDAVPVSRETELRLERFERLILERNQTLSLISHATEPDIWVRHFLDSAQLAKLIADPEAPIVDIGTGAGFPGMILAVLGLPNIHLVEHNIQKVEFLRRVVAELDLPVTIHPMKSEAVRPFPVGVLTARALKPLDQLIGLGHRLIGPGTACLFPKGRRAEEELQTAQRRWRMTVERFPSVTDPDSTIFRLTNVIEAT
jgi:16S rRNA (guanine527-N7)-methyltransferase